MAVSRKIPRKPLARPFPPVVLEAWRTGADRFNEGRYWHAHEEWERHWLDLPAPDRDYVQALIQAAGAFHLLGKSRGGPARSLCLKALLKLASIERRFPELARARPRLEIPGLGPALERLVEAGEGSDGACWRGSVESLRAHLLL